MESSFVFRTLRGNRPAALFAALIALATVPAVATTFQPSTTIKAGTKIACVLDEAINSATLQPGTDFKLRVVDTTQAVLNGGEIHGHITDVRQGDTMDRARIGFLLDSIHLSNGTKKPISSYVVNKAVVQYNPAAKHAAQQQLPPSAPYGTVTPGPIAWQMRIGGGEKPSVSTRPTTAVGGYVYAQQMNEPIVIKAGVPVTVELQKDLTIP